MEIETIMQLISGVGFPIAACIGIFYVLERERTDHKNEVDALKSVIGDINETLSALKQLIQDKLS